jgi:hypothetical protein
LLSNLIPADQLKVEMSSDRRHPDGLVLVMVSSGLSALATHLVGSLPGWLKGSLIVLVLLLLLLLLIPRRHVEKFRTAVRAIWASARRALARPWSDSKAPPVRDCRRFWHRIAVLTGGLAMLITLTTIARPLVLDTDQPKWPADPTVVACYENLDRNAKAAVLQTTQVDEPGGAIAACRAEWPRAFGHVAPDNLVNCVLAEGGQAVFPGGGIRAPEEVCRVVNAKPFF